MSSVQFVKEYRIEGLTYFVLSVRHPFPSGVFHFHEGNIDGVQLLINYFDFVKPKEEKWVRDIQIRSDAGIDRITAGLRNANDTTYLTVTEKGQIAASFSIYGSLLDRQAGLVAHVRTHENHRKKGLSTVLSEVAHQDWYGDDPEKFLILHVTNPQAQRIYGRQGYVTLVGKISDRDEEPGEAMGRPAHHGISMTKLIRDRYSNYNEASLTRRPVERSDIAGFIALFAVAGKLDAGLAKLKMSHANTSEDRFTQLMLENSKEIVVEGMFDSKNALVGVTVFARGKREECEVYKIHY